MNDKPTTNNNSKNYVNYYTAFVKIILTVNLSLTKWLQ